MKFDYEVIGSRIKKAREIQHYTQEEMAEYLDVTSAYISKIERGKSKINLETLGKICTFLNLTPAYILMGTQKDNNQYLRNEVNSLLNNCPPEKVKMIVEIIKVIIKQP